MKKFIFLCAFAVTLLVAGGCQNKEDALSKEPVAPQEEAKENAEENQETAEDPFVQWEKEYPNPLSGKAFTDFEAEDLKGNKVDQSIFKEKKLTLVNLWASYCGPCLKEIPDLQKLQNQYAEDFQVLGILADGKNDGGLMAGKKIIEKNEISYTNIIIEDNLAEQLGGNFNYVPVSLFVDKEGNILSLFIPGAMDYESFVKFVDHLLEAQK